MASMKSNSLILLIFTGILTTVLTACKTNNKIGFDDNDPLTVEINDSIKVIASTYLLDSLPSSNTGTIMLGANEDPAFGKLKLSSYFRIKAPAQSDLPKDAVFDSLRLVLKYSKYSYGDTTKLQQLVVHRLKELIKLHKVNNDVEPEEKPLFVTNEDALFTTSTVKYDATPIGTHSYKPSPGSKDSVSIKLDDKWGNELFKMLVEKDKRLSSADDFLNYFKGMHIESINSSAVIGFNADNLKMLVHYHYRNNNGFPETGKSEFVMHDKQYQFNHIEADRQATSLKGLNQKNQEVDALTTGQQLFLQGGSGIVTKILLPGLTQFMHEPGIVVNKVELIIQTKPSTYALYKVPASLILFIANDRNTPKFTIPDAYETTTQQAAFRPGNDNGALASFTFNLSEYADKIKKGEYKNTSLLLSLPIDDLIKTVNRAHITNDKSTLSVSTRITYTKY